MLLLRTTCVLFLFAIVTGAQNENTPAQGPPAAISCSAHIPADSCKWVTSVFALHQLSSSLRQINIVIDEKQVFSQEKERLLEPTARVLVSRRSLSQRI